MDSKVQTGYLVLADISGYTSYLADTELEHAHEILSDLLDAVIERVSSKLTVAEVEGDAVFAYAPASAISRGESLLELIEMAYVAFRDRRDSTRRLTTCVCRACSQIGKLDLKFVAHFGSFVLQRFGGHDKPFGTDVNLAHRLLKNHVADTTGWKGYSLFSDSCLEQLGLRVDGLHQQPETYEHLGEIQTHSLNLHGRYDEIKDRQRVAVAPEHAHERVSHEFPWGVDVIWDWLADAEKKGQWMEGTRWSPEVRPNGRTGPGAVNHCCHGRNNVLAEEILDWRPMEYFTTKCRIGPIDLLMTVRLVPGESRTVLDATFKIDSSLPPWLLRPTARMIVKLGKYDATWRRLDDVIGEALSGSATSSGPAKLHDVSC